MKIWVSRYELTPRSRLSAVARPGPRHGALIRVDDGFADVHPWEELGDEPLEEQLARLARGEHTSLTAASLRHAEADAAMRRAGKSSFEGLEIPDSHWPADAGDVPDAFDTVKIKASPSTRAESLLPFVGRGLRLDFNNTMTAGSFAAFIESLPTAVRESIDFFEDPFPYEPGAWEAARSSLGLRLALDRGEATTGVDALVVKPAVRLDLPSFAGRVVVTSYMDHPVGVLGAALVAAQNAGRVDPRCGLLTHLLYEPDAFSDRLCVNGARLVPPASGTGIGFDDLLERLPWKRLN